jgi:hypothetical protein
VPPTQLLVRAQPLATAARSTNIADPPPHTVPSTMAAKQPSDLASLKVSRSVHMVAVGKDRRVKEARSAIVARVTGIVALLLITVRLLVAVRLHLVAALELVRNCAGCTENITGLVCCDR